MRDGFVYFFDRINMMEMMNLLNGEAKKSC